MPSQGEKKRRGSPTGRKNPKDKQRSRSPKSPNTGHRRGTLKLDLTEHENLIEQMRAEPRFENLPLYEPSPTQREIDAVDAQEAEQERLLQEQEDKALAKQLALLEKEQKKGRMAQMQIEAQIKSLAALD